MTETRDPSMLDDGFVRAGLALLLLGTGPLVAIILAAALGLTRDPNPNPIGPGMLAVLTFWPAVVLLALGVVRARRRGARWQWPASWPRARPWGGDHPPTALRVAAGVASVGLSPVPPVVTMSRYPRSTSAASEAASRSSSSAGRVATGPRASLRCEGRRSRPVRRCPRAPPLRSVSRR